MDEKLKNEVELEVRRVLSQEMQQHRDTDSSHAIQKEKHELLYVAFKEDFKGLIDSEFRHAMFLVILVGWLITAKHAQEMLGSTPAMQWVLTFAILLNTSFHAILVSLQYQGSKKVYYFLTELAYMPPKYFESQRIRPFLATLFCVFHTFMSTGIVFMVWAMPSVVEAFMK